MLPAYDDLPLRRAWQLRAPWWRRLSGEADADADGKLRLWTIQSPEAYEILRRDGTLHGSPDHITPEYARPYAWLEEQAAHRLPTEPGTLLWLWVRADNDHLRGCARYGEEEVLLEVTIPRDHVLISAFGQWHSCLNGYPVIPVLPGETPQGWSRRADEIYEVLAPYKHDRPVPEILVQIMQWTWAAILDPATFEDDEVLQGVVHQLHSHQVVRAVRLRERAR